MSKTVVRNDIIFHFVFVLPEYCGGGGAGGGGDADILSSAEFFVPIWCL